MKLFPSEIQDLVGRCHAIDNLLPATGKLRGELVSDIMLLLSVCFQKNVALTS